MLHVTYPSGPNPDRMLVLRIDGFQSLRIPTLSGDHAEFRELEIRDISSDQIEGVHYRIADYRTEFECDCDRVVLHAVYAFQHESVGEVIWEAPM